VVCIFRLVQTLCAAARLWVGYFTRGLDLLERLLAGTLGGISVLARENVQLSYTTANSGVKHDWITAIVPVGGEWMVGTYGAGVLGMDTQGRFYSMGEATGPFDVDWGSCTASTRSAYCTSRSRKILCSLLKHVAKLTTGKGHRPYPNFQRFEIPDNVGWRFFGFVFNPLKDMVGPCGLEPQTSTVSTYGD
jgi:hypothetical protein